MSGQQDYVGRTVEAVQIRCLWCLAATHREGEWDHRRSPAPSSNALKRLGPEEHAVQQRWRLRTSPKVGVARWLCGQLLRLADVLVFPTERPEASQ